MPDLQTFLNQDLVLQVSPSVDPDRFDITRYEPFLDALCGAREYQKGAITFTPRSGRVSRWNLHGAARLPLIGGGSAHRGTGATD